MNLVAVCPGVAIHVHNIAKICKQRLYLLTRLREQGLSQRLVKVVFEAIVISRITYAAPAWRGYASRKTPAWRGYASRADACLEGVRIQDRRLPGEVRIQDRRLPGGVTHPQQMPAWRGYSSRADIDLIQKLFVKARR